MKNKVKDEDKHQDYYNEAIFAKSPSMLLLSTELARTGLGLGAYFASFPLLQMTTMGDGHPVLVLPGFLTNDWVTTPLRTFLQSRNYDAKPWELGNNLAHYDVLEQQLNHIVRDLAAVYDRKVSVIGWSAGGIFARALGHTAADSVRQVITLGSPFRGIKDKTNIEGILGWVTGKHPANIDRVILERASEPPPVPSTAIYTKMDGVVYWDSCRDKHSDDRTENVEVMASHLDLGFNPMSLYCIADRLAQPEGEWKPYQAPLWSQWLTAFPWELL